MTPSEPQLLDDPVEDAEEALHLVIATIEPVIGPFRALRVPPARALEALCLLAGVNAALTHREVEQLLPVIEEGREDAAGIEDRPVPVPFCADRPRQVEGLVRHMIHALVRLCQRRHLGTGQVVHGLAYLAGQVSTLVEIPPEALRALLQAGIERGRPHAGELLPVGSTRGVRA